ncbi:MAG: hypothetical protein ACPG5P_02770, partial [Saprospiraceae bacterium]
INTLKNFQSALKNEGCEYWAELYQALFENNFQWNGKEALLRLNVPQEIKEQGAAAFGRYMQEIKDNSKS